MDHERSGPAAGLLRGYRREARLSQRQLAELAGVSIGVVRDLEQGRTARLRPESVLRLGRALRLGRGQAAELARAARPAAAPSRGRPLALRLSVLGPLRAWRREPISLGGPRQRAVLGLLALHPESGLSRTAIIDALWGHDPPATAVAMVQSYVSQLRRLLGAGATDSPLGATAGGYRLTAAACDLDHLAFTALVRQAGDAHATGRIPAACAAYDAALRLWTGEPLTDVEILRDHPAVTRLNLQRAAAVTGYADAAAAAGWHERVLGPLHDLTVREPLNERAHARLMVALAGSGQQAAALRLHEGLRRRLDQQLGIRPGAELADAHVRVLRQDGSGGPAGPPRPAPVVVSGPPVPLLRARSGQLPAPAAHFAGRAAELAVLTSQRRRSERAVPGTVVISAIDGMPGVGKTALAVQAGYLVAGRFPDGQLFVDLHGHTPGQRAADPADVLAGLLAADGVDPRYLPADLDGRAAMWRERMTGRRVLLILDDAANSAQVKPLLPGSADSLVLVTSRRFLGDLDAAVTEVPLGVLGPDEARAMFIGLAGRAASEPGQVAELVALCGYLPLAVSLLARLFTRHRSWALADLIGETRYRLLTVSAEHQTIAAVFGMSYGDLDTERQRFLRHLGLHPGPDTDAYAAAALAGVPLRQAADHLTGLVGDRLLEEPAPGRYRMHDLIRQYARALAEPDAEARGQATERLLDYYQHVAGAAAGRVTRHGRPPGLERAMAVAAAPVLADRERAGAWLTAERANLLSCLAGAAARGEHARVVGLSAAMAAHLRSDGPWPQAIAVHAAAARAARAIGDQPGEAGALLSLGDVRHAAGEYPDATRALEQALGIFRGIGDRPGEASALFCLAEIRRSTGDYPGATRLLEQALRMSRRLGSRRSEASILFCLADVRQATGDYGAATTALEQSLDAWRGVGDRSGEANALCWLGKVRHLTGDVPGAISLLEQSLEISRAIGSRIGEAGTLFCLAAVRQVTGDYAAATAALEQAVTLYRGIGSRHGEAQALCRLGQARQATGDLAGAADALEESLRMSRDAGNRLGEANALQYLGGLRQSTGDLAGAAGLLAQSLDMFRAIGDRLGEAEVLGQTGTLYLARGDPQRSLAQHQRALRLARTIGSRLEEARALEGIGKCAWAGRSPGTADRALSRALEIYRRLGAAEAPRLAAELAAAG